MREMIRGQVEKILFEKNFLWVAAVNFLLTSAFHLLFQLKIKWTKKIKIHLSFFNRNNFYRTGLSRGFTFFKNGMISCF